MTLKSHKFTFRKNFFRWHYFYLVKQYNFCYFIFFILKTNGLQENLTTPRGAADIFSSKNIDKSGKSRFVFNTRAK